MLNIYNWLTTCPEGMIAAFEKKPASRSTTTPLKPTKPQRQAGGRHTGYDIGAGTAFSPAYRSKPVQPLDKAKLPNYKNQTLPSPGALVKADPTTSTVPWAWGFTTVGINKRPRSRRL